MALPFNLSKEELAREGYLLQKRVDIDIDLQFMSIHEKVSDFTMTSLERQYALFKATQYVIRNNIPGDFVECGVWKGGSVMLVLQTLLELGETSRNIFIYDTFSGMSEPSPKDKRYNNIDTHEVWESRKTADINSWCYAPLEEVKENIARIGYPKEKIVFVVGKVEETIPGVIPNGISLLRLDTDWYESTSHELKHLFPRLIKGGVLIIDDYGCWEGARAAVDEYFEEQKLPVFLNRIDYTARLAIKQ